MSFFFFNDTATTEIYTLSLHDALPIWPDRARPRSGRARRGTRPDGFAHGRRWKSTRLNSSHSQISYAVFCLKKKKTPALPVPADQLGTLLVADPCVPLPDERVCQLSVC